MSATAVDTLIASVAGALVGSLITLFVSCRIENFREKRKQEQRTRAVARAIASEVHAHLEAIHALLNEQCETWNGLWAKIVDTQWQQYQNEVWQLDPNAGIVFRRYYNELARLQSKALTHSADIKKEFAPLLELAERCLDSADFPLRRVEVCADLRRDVI